ncbi:MAG: hypothetical protein H7A21_08610 [Spirochaetales bacterium]|nr:hypothetical protein [Leptospiraceae bacterium]MCP5481478.1 hypothetical protein [Spirochaetales bacterium]MCP5484307.1 hypothetical protein [Spirochaetales bacterium]
METSEEYHFHEQLLSEQGAFSAIQLYGGDLRDEAEQVYRNLTKSIGRPDGRGLNSYGHYPRMQALLDGAGLLERWLDRPADKAREAFLACISFLRENDIIEILPVIEDQSGLLMCADYILMADHRVDNLDTAPIKKQALLNSASAAGRSMAARGLDVDRIESKIRGRDAAFVDQLPAFVIRETMMSAWHSPHASGVCDFLPILKQREFAGPINESLIENGSLLIKRGTKMGSAFPYGWPNSPNAMPGLLRAHQAARRAFLCDVIGLEGATPNGWSIPLEYSTLNSPSFAAALEKYRSDARPVPRLAAIHNMALHAFNAGSKRLMARGVEGKRELHFARNILAFVLLHGEAVIEQTKNKEGERLDEVIRKYISDLKATSSPFANLDAMVRLENEVVQTEEIRARVIREVRRARAVYSTDVIDERGRASQRIIFAFHADRITEVFDASSKSALENANFRTHLRLEKIIKENGLEDGLKEKIGEPAHLRFLRARRELYVHTLPFWKRMLWSLFFSTRQPKSSDLDAAVHKALERDAANFRAFEKQEEERAAEKRKQEIKQDLRRGKGRESTSAAGTSTSLAGSSASPGGASASTSVSSPAGMTGNGQNPGPGTASPPVVRVDDSDRAPETPASFDSDRNDGATADVPSQSELQGAATTPQSSGEPNPGTAPQDQPATPTASETGEANAPDGIGQDRVETAGGEFPPQNDLEAGAQTPAASGEQVERRARPREESWEHSVVRMGAALGVDLTEERRKERAKEKEAERKKKRLEQARKKRMEAKKKRAQARRPTTEALLSPASSVESSSRNHDKPSRGHIRISIPVQFTVSGKPTYIEFKKKSFKDASFRTQMVDFYRDEKRKSKDQDDQDYFQFLIQAIEGDYQRYL